MGVQSSPVLAVGLEFESEREAEDLLREHGFLDDVKGSDIEADGLSEHVPSGLIFQSLDLYTGGYYYLGINLRAGSIESFRKDFEDAVEKFDNMFKGGVEPQLIHTVRYH